ncbi:MAG TPA: hypothetical protein VGG26_08075 [Terracidiphilus sp.]|jgi:hypothetical protein
MSSVTVVTKLAGAESSFATKDAESLQKLFQLMKAETLRTPAKASHRLFVRVYDFSSQKSRPAIEQ